MNRKIKFDIWTLLALGLLALYGIFSHLSLLNLMAQSVIDEETGQFTLAYFLKFFRSPYYFNTLLNSFKVTFAVTVTTIVLATPLAYIFTRYEIKGKEILRILIIISSMSAPFIGLIHGSCCSAGAASSRFSCGIRWGSIFPAFTDSTESCWC